MKKPTVFISYSHADSDFVDWLAGKLKASGVDVWVDKWKIKVGDSVTQKINEGIGASDFLLVVLSRASVNSKWVREELNAATIRNIEQEKHAFILPVLIEECEIPVLLQHREYASFKDDAEQAFQELLEVIQSIEDVVAVTADGPSNTRSLIGRPLSRFQFLPRTKLSLQRWAAMATIIGAFIATLALLRDVFDFTLLEQRSSPQVQLTSSAASLVAAPTLTSTPAGGPAPIYTLLPSPLPPPVETSMPIKVPGPTYTPNAYFVNPAELLDAAATIRSVKRVNLDNRGPEEILISSEPEDWPIGGAVDVYAFVNGGWSNVHHQHSTCGVMDFQTGKLTDTELTQVVVIEQCGTWGLIQFWVVEYTGLGVARQLFTIGMDDVDELPTGVHVIDAELVATYLSGESYTYRWNGSTFVQLTSTPLPIPGEVFVEYCRGEPKQSTVELQVYQVLRVRRTPECDDPNPPHVGRLFVCDGEKALEVLEFLLPDGWRAKQPGTAGVTADALGHNCVTVVVK